MKTQLKGISYYQATHNHQDFSDTPGRTNMIIGRHLIVCAAQNLYVYVVDNNLCLEKVTYSMSDIFLSRLQ